MYKSSSRFIQKMASQGLAGHKVSSLASKGRPERGAEKDPPHFRPPNRPFSLFAEYQGLERLTTYTLDFGGRYMENRILVGIRFFSNDITLLDSTANGASLTDQALDPAIPRRSLLASCEPPGNESAKVSCTSACDAVDGSPTTDQPVCG